jgi:hypothetical protein
MHVRIFLLRAVVLMDCVDGILKFQTFSRIYVKRDFMLRQLILKIFRNCFHSIKFKYKTIEKLEKRKTLRAIHD